VQDGWVLAGGDGREWKVAWLIASSPVALHSQQTWETMQGDIANPRMETECGRTKLMSGQVLGLLGRGEGWGKLGVGSGLTSSFCRTHGDELCPELVFPPRTRFAGRAAFTGFSRGKSGFQASFYGAACKYRVVFGTQ
jgi:hypothetical protein